MLKFFKHFTFLGFVHEAKLKNSGSVLLSASQVIDVVSIINDSQNKLLYILYILFSMKVAAHTVARAQADEATLAPFCRDLIRNASAALVSSSSSLGNARNSQTRN